LATLNKKIPY